MNNRNSKVVITGGHFTPAQAIVDELIKNNKWSIWYVCSKHAQEEDLSISVEYKTILKYREKVNLLLILTGKLQRYLSLKSIFSFFKIPIGLFQSIYWLILIKPDVILSFGGYISFPICIAGYLLGIPIVIHEQTKSIGFANRFIARIASIICLSWSNVKNEFKNKTVVTGLPIRKAVFTINKALPLDLDKPLLYITGGNLGSHNINLLFLSILPKLLRQFSIIHQCGFTEKYADLEKLEEFKKSLSPSLQQDYLPVGFVTEEYIGWLYKNCMFAVGRAGANTVYELASVSIPAIFIPIPFSANNEQELNAVFFKENKAGIILSQKGLTSGKLYQEIMEFYKKISKYKSNAKELKKKIILNGTENLIHELNLIYNV